jgi:hypothetical protein
MIAAVFGVVVSVGSRGFLDLVHLLSCCSCWGLLVVVGILQKVDFSTRGSS